MGTIKYVNKEIRTQPSFSKASRLTVNKEIYKTIIHHHPYLILLNTCWFTVKEKIQNNLPLGSAFGNSFVHSVPRFRGKPKR